jgi:hypothetical protein
MAHIFISYARENLDFAEVVKQHLESKGCEVWWDQQTPAGEDWRQQIDAAIADAFALIVILSPEAHRSLYVTYEWAFARGLGKRIIPLMRADTEIHEALATLQHIDFTTRSRPWAKLMQEVNRARADDEEAVWTKLKSALRSTDPQARRAAMDQLRDMYRLKDIEEVVSVLFSDRYIAQVRAAAAHALGNMGDTAAPYLIRALSDRDKHTVRHRAAESLVRIGEPAVPHLLGEAVQNSDPDALRRIAWALGAIDSEEAVPTLIGMLDDRRKTPSYAQRVSDAAADALGKFDSLAAQDAIVNYWLGELNNTRKHWKRDMRICDFAADILEGIDRDDVQAQLEAWRREQGR